jgi:glutathione S-transferase
MTTIPHFVCFPISPWSIKAKWALDHHRIRYRLHEHLPLVGEPLLRLRARNWTGRATAPVLVTKSGSIGSSWEIARWADRNSEGKKLIPNEQADVIAEWNARSDAMLEAGRSLLLQNMLASPAALAEGVPAPRALRSSLTGVGALGVRFLVGKYGTKADPERSRDEMRIGFRALREALGERDHLLGELSYADIAMVVATFFLRPPRGRVQPMGEATRECWAQPELAEEFADVLAWRERMIDRFFPA